MSTYHYYCKKCNENYHDSFIRMAWGWGNADVIQFIKKHTDICGGKMITVLSEDHWEKGND